jgi:phosphoribosyl 1,2-cyclic phosphodiesterase
MDQSSFSLKFWGVRGSYPVAQADSLRYGGNTSCVELNAAGQRVIFDAGTGIIRLGKEILAKNKAPLVLHLMLSHTHHDHLLGFYFFEPLFDKRNLIYIFGPGSGRRSLNQTLKAAMDPTLFPVGLDAAPAKKLIRSLAGDESIEFREGARASTVVQTLRSKHTDRRKLTIRTHMSHAHPNGVMLYRAFYNGKSVVYASDVEEQHGGYPEIIEFVRGADVLIHDAQYLTAEYPRRKGWGHSTVERAAEVARKAAVKRLVLFHHEPTHDDRCIDRIGKLARRLFPASLVAAEGMILRL